jgi:hypothetical protein
MQEVKVTPETPVIPATPAPPQGPQVFIQVPGGGPLIRSGSPSAVYEGFRNQRRELADQLERLEDQRENISRELQEPMVTGVNQKGLEQRLAGVDLRIAETEKALAEAEAAVARSAAVPGAVQPPPPPRPRDGPPEEFFVLAGIFMFIVVLPLTIAYARRIWRRGAAVVSAIPQEIYDRFNRIDQAIDSVAIEVERIGEGQRFLTRVYAEQQRALGAGPAERVEIPERERLQQRKSP